MRALVLLFWVIYILFSIETRPSDIYSNSNEYSFFTIPLQIYCILFHLYFVSCAIPGGVQGFLLTLGSGIAPRRIGGPDMVPDMKPKLAVYKASAQPTHCAIYRSLILYMPFIIYAIITGARWLSSFWFLFSWY